MNGEFTPYIGSHEKVMGSTVYVKMNSGYIPAKVIEYIFPKNGIIGSYRVKTAVGKIIKVTTLYQPKAYIECFRTAKYHEFPCKNCPFSKKCGRYKEEATA